VLLGDPDYDAAVDIWGFGCCVAEMFRGKPLFAGTSELDQIQRIFAVLGDSILSWPLIFVL
jgi:serine/threonine protein kinase